MHLADQRPRYNVASPFPLVLWKCDFAQDVLPEMYQSAQNFIQLERRTGEVKLSVN
jgi:hypothetical protein